MSSGGFHVHGPHDHELEHAAQGAHGASHESNGGMIAQIAVITAIIATVGALFSYMGGATQANAGLYKNNAAIKKTEASNQWNFFQAKSTKQSLAELARDLAFLPEYVRAHPRHVDRLTQGTIFQCLLYRLQCKRHGQQLLDLFLIEIANHVFRCA